MVKYAKEELGADYIATGHYARITYDEHLQRYQLRRAIDRSKDQTYFLYDLEQDILAATVFPLGDTLKTQTRELAAGLNLSTADKPESQDLCLVGKTRLDEKLSSIDILPNVPAISSILKGKSWVNIWASIIIRSGNAEASD